MPNLEQFLSKHYATSANQGEHICKYCEKFIPKSMSQHYRYCNEKKLFEDKLGLTNNVPTPTPIQNIQVEVANVAQKQLQPQKILKRTK
jgi:hypothetical protein